jgi:hypothetical protein
VLTGLCAPRAACMHPRELLSLILSSLCFLLCPSLRLRHGREVRGGTARRPAPVGQRSARPGSGQSARSASLQARSIRGREVCGESICMWHGGQRVPPSLGFARAARPLTASLVRSLCLSTLVFALLPRPLLPPSSGGAYAAFAFRRARALASPRVARSRVLSRLVSSRLDSPPSQPLKAADR